MDLGGDSGKLKHFYTVTRSYDTYAITASIICSRLQVWNFWTMVCIACRLQERCNTECLSSTTGGMAAAQLFRFCCSLRYVHCIEIYATTLIDVPTACGEAEAQCAVCTYVAWNCGCALGHSRSPHLHVLWVRGLSHWITSAIEIDTKPRLATNIIVSSMLILGGSATVTDLTGMSTIAVSDNPKKNNCVSPIYSWYWRHVSSSLLVSVSTS
jgi:hypothetical protein